MWANPDPLHSLGIRARNLGIDDWQVWSSGDEDALGDLVAPGGPRCVVVDLGSLPRQGEQAAAAEATLAALWRRRGAREPMLIVIDEAHNVCPGSPADPLTALATEHAVRIAGEGRKFGLILLVATQRPQKVHENVISQCDNLVLMRMNSRSDLAALAETFSAVPSSLLGLATEFRQGEAIVSGKLVPGPTLGRFGPRWSVEGGADVPSDWADALTVARRSRRPPAQLGGFGREAPDAVGFVEPREVRAPRVGDVVHRQPDEQHRGRRPRLARQAHPDLLEQPVTLAEVARRARGDHVLPHRVAPAGARDDVVERQPPAAGAAVHALPPVAREQRPPGDAPLHRLRDADVVDEADHVRADVRVRRRSQRLVVALENLGPALAHEHVCPAHRAHIQWFVARIQDEYLVHFSRA